VKLAESPSFGKTIFEYAPESIGARDFASLSHEVLAREAARPRQATPAADAAAGAVRSAEPTSPPRSPARARHRPVRVSESRGGEGSGGERGRASDPAPEPPVEPAPAPVAREVAPLPRARPAGS
jgi:hypothetical protein